VVEDGLVYRCPFEYEYRCAEYEHCCAEYEYRFAEYEYDEFGNALMPRLFYYPENNPGYCRYQGGYPVFRIE